MAEEFTVVILAEGVELPAAAPLPSSHDLWNFLLDASGLAGGESLLSALGIELPGESRVLALSISPDGSHAWVPITEETSVIPKVQGAVHVFWQKTGVIDYLLSFWKRARRLKLPELKGHVQFAEWIQLNQMGVPVPRRKGLYIRECFHDFYESLAAAAQLHAFIKVTGTPGLGKSAFLWYVVLRVAISRDYDLVVQLVAGRKSDTSKVLVFRRDGSVGFHSEFPEFGSLKLPDRGKVLQLVDERYIGNHLKTVVIFADPKAKNTSLVTKGGGGSCCTRILPSWRGYEAELFELYKAEGFSDSGEVSSIVETWGLIPRIVLDGQPGSVTEETIGSWATVYNLRLIWYTMADCNFFELVPTDQTYATGALRFASRHIAELFFKVYWAHWRDELVLFLQSPSRQIEYAALRNFLFRNFVLCSLAQDSLPEFQGLSWRNREFRDLDSLEEIRAAIENGENAAKYLWKPRECNQAYDAIALPWILRFTVEEEEECGLTELFVKELSTASQLLMACTSQQLQYLVVTPWATSAGPCSPPHSSARTIACYRATFSFEGGGSLVSKKFTGKVANPF